MTITRYSLWEEIAELDGEIKQSNESKSGCFEAYRAQLENEGRTKGQISKEIKACKKAFNKIRSLMNNRADIEEQDALIDEIITEIERGTDRATRAPREKKSTERPVIAPSGEPAAETGQANAAGSNNSDESESIPPFLRRVV